MTSAARPWSERYLLPLSLGIADGIVNALTLASGAVLSGTGLDAVLALRVGAVALVTAVFTVFVAEYAQLRAELAGAARALSLTTSGQLASTRLGRQVIGEAAIAAAIASLASFVGATVPLLGGALFRGLGWLALVVSVVALGVLGVALARAVGGSRLRWVSALVVMGAAVAALGTQLDIT